MRGTQEDTPPSSINGDEVTMDEEEVIYLDEMEEIGIDELMDRVYQEVQEEEYVGNNPPERDDAVLIFKDHLHRSVFCCDIHPDGKFAVTGAEDDNAFVWLVESGQLVTECFGHKDSVIYVGFSFDGTYLATADMSGLIKVWKSIEFNQLEMWPWPKVFEYECDEVVWGLWHFGAAVLICGTNSGDIYVFKIPSGETKILQGHNQKVECGKLFNDGLRLVAGYEDGSVKIWDLKSCTVLQQIPAGTHQGPVTAIDIHPDNNLVASISAYDDEPSTLVLTTANNGKIVGQLQAEKGLEVVAFSKDPQLGYFALGTLKGSVSIWEVGKQMVRHQCAKAGDQGVTGVTKMLWVKDQLITGCLDGSVRVYDSKSGESSLVLFGHEDEVLDMSYNEKANLILTASDDGTARIFEYDVNKAKS